jgi:hypothetical protein
MKIDSIDLSVTFEYDLTNILDALWHSLLFVEDSCSQLENEIRLRHFDAATHEAQQAVKVLLAGSGAYRRITAGLRGLNESTSSLILIRRRMRVAQAMMVILMKRVKTEAASPRIRQLIDGLQAAIDTSGVNR